MDNGGRQMAVLFFAIVCISSIFGLWYVRAKRWPRVQVRVLKTWDEITGYVDDIAIGWLHADIEYWYESQKYAVSWRDDLLNHRFLPDTLWMIVDPANPDQPHIPTGRTVSVVLLLIAIVAGLSALRSLAN